MDKEGAKNFWGAGEKKTNMGALKIGMLIGLLPLIALSALYCLALAAAWIFWWVYEWFGLLGALIFAISIGISIGNGIGNTIVSALFNKK